MDKSVEIRREEVSSLVESMQIPCPFIPQKPACFVEDASPNTLETDALIEHMAYWSALTGYTDYQASILEGAATIEEVEYENAYNAEYSIRTEQHVTDKRGIAGGKKTIREKRSHAARLKADAGVVRALANAFDKRYNALSRELTRRTKEIEKGTR